MKRRYNSNQNQAAGKKPKRFNQALPAAQIFKGLLPQGYQQKWALIEQYQHFFNAQESDAVFKMVKVLNVTDRDLIVSVPNPALANYLRLHSPQIIQMIKENFNQSLSLKISAAPESRTPGAGRSKLTPARHYSAKVCEQLADAAVTVEDEALQAALKSLSRIIKK